MLPKDKVTIVKLTLKNLTDQGYTNEEAEEFIELFNEQLEGIRIRINYQDILLNPQEAYEREFHSPN